MWNGNSLKIEQSQSVSMYRKLHIIINKSITKQYLLSLKNHYTLRNSSQ